MLKKWFLSILLCFVICINEALAVSFDQKNDHVKLTTIPQFSEISTNTREISLITKIKIKPDWHIYWDNPGDSGDPTVLIYKDSPHYTITNNIHSAPVKSVFHDIITTYIHKQNLYFKTTFSLKDTDDLKELPFRLVLSYTACKKECLSEKLTLDFSLPVTQTPLKNPEYQQNDILAENTFPLALEIDPQFDNNIVNIKITESILKDCPKPEFVSYHQKRNILSDLPQTKVLLNGDVRITFDDKEAPAHTDGLLLCDTHAYELHNKQPLSDNTSNTSRTFLYYFITAILAGLILNLMPCVLPILSLKALYLAAHKEKASLSSALIYLSGVLCSFLVLSGMLFYLRGIGAQLGWGFQLQSPAFNIFLLILFLLIFLSLIDKLQIPDTFADKLHKISANQSFLTGFFAVIIACPCTGPFMGAALGYALREPPLIYFTIFMSLGLGYALPYVLIETFPGFFLKFIPKPGAWMLTLKHILAIPIALTCLWLGWVTFHQLRTQATDNELLWEPYNKKNVEQALNNNEPVLIDFTAKWCLICLLNDKTVLSSKKFESLAQKQKLRLFKADWTNHNKEITEALTSHNRNSVPLYVYYKKGAKTPQYLPQILTLDILEKNF